MSKTELFDLGDVELELIALGLIGDRDKVVISLSLGHFSSHKLACLEVLGFRGQRLGRMNLKSNNEIRIFLDNLSLGDGLPFQLGWFIDSK